MRATSRALDLLLRAVGDPMRELRHIGAGHPEFHRAQVLRAGTAVLAKVPHAFPAISQAVATLDKNAALTGASRLPVVAAWGPVTVFALLLAVVVGFNFRVANTRSESPPWSAVVTAARQACMQPGMADYEYSHLWWQVRIPCSRV